MWLLNFFIKCPTVPLSQGGTKWDKVGQRDRVGQQDSGTKRDRGVGLDIGGDFAVCC